jgi:hypothetical protein
MLIVLRSLLVTVAVVAIGVSVAVSTFVFAIGEWEIAGLLVAAVAFAAMWCVGLAMRRRFPVAAIATTATAAVVLVVAIIALVAAVAAVTM